MRITKLNWFRIELMLALTILLAPMSVSFAEEIKGLDVKNTQNIDCILGKFKKGKYSTFALPTDKNLASDKDRKRVKAGQGLVKILADRCKKEQGWTGRQHALALLVVFSEFKLEKRTEELDAADIDVVIVDRMYKRLTDEDIRVFLEGKIPSDFGRILVEEFRAEGARISDDGNIIEGKTVEESYLIGRYVGGYVISSYVIDQLSKSFASDAHKNAVLGDFFRKMGLDVYAL